MTLLLVIIVIFNLFFTLNSKNTESVVLKAATLLNLELFNDSTSPSFTIQINGTNYFESNYFQYNSHNSSSSNTLKVLSISSINSGNDYLGSFNFIDINWSTNWITTIKVYNNKDAIAFKQTFTAKPTVDINLINNNFKIKQVTVNNGYVFPTICQSASSSEQFGILQYRDKDITIQSYKSLEEFNNLSNPKASQLVLSPKRYPSPFTLIYGSLNDFFVQFIGAAPASVAVNNNNKCFSSFIPYSFNNDIPNGYTTESILIAVSTDAVSGGYQTNRILMPSSGINAGLMEYGDVLLSKYNVKNRPNILDNIGPSNRIKDYIGYSTTAFYFYNPCDCYTFNNDTAHLECTGDNTAFKGCQTYQDTLIAYYNDMISTINQTHSYSIMNHILIDSWWYGEAYYNGVNFWEDNNDYLQVIKSFPSGLAYFWKSVGYPSIYAHTGAWIANNTYQYQSEINNNIYGKWIPPAMPQDNKLWNYLFKQSHSWGLSLLKHDHLYNMYDTTPSVLTNISVCYNWLSGMNDAALLNNIDIHYSAAQHSAFWLSSTMYKSVKFTRGSDDYVGNGGEKSQWTMAPESIFDYSLGLIAYKDTFYSNTSITEKCNDCRLSGYTEYAPWIHAISGLLSGGPVTVSDKIGSTNYTLINMTVRNDGKLLKPSVVYMPVELEWYSIMFREWPYSTVVDTRTDLKGGYPNGNLGELYTTYSRIDDEYIWYYLWSVQLLNQNIYVTNSDLNIKYDVNNNTTQQVVIYEWNMNDNKYGVNINGNGSFQFIEIDNNQQTWSVNVTTRGVNNNEYGSYTMISITNVLYKNGWILLGEVGKVLSVSPIRIESISVNNIQTGNVEILVNGIENESIKLSFIKWKTSNIKTVECIILNEGTVKILINNDEFTCSTTSYS